jgi:plastocyanin
MRTRIFAVVALVALLAPACGSSKKNTATGTTLPAAFAHPVDLRGKATGGEYPEVDVAAKDNDFSPTAIRIDPGTTVKFTNQGRSPHDITAVVFGQPTGKEMGVAAAAFGPGKTYEYRFASPGVYRYYCSLHGSPSTGMIGEIVVGDVDAVTGKSGGGSTSSGTASGTLRVPSQYHTIQAAVTAAKPGSLVLVSPGVYHEAVTVTTPDLDIRGLSRTGTVLDGGFTRDNGFKVLADGVAIENMTARDYKSNGFFWTGVTGYRGSYLNAIRNGDYGIYAFGSTHGQFDHDYGAGSPDAGFYIGQCTKCDAVITDSISEWNGIGYSGTNAGGNLSIIKSVWRDNRVGIVPNSGTEELNPPQRDATIVGNKVYDNNNGKTAAIDIAQLAIGNGILLAGGNDDTVERNLVYGHDLVGIAAIPLPEKVINPGDKKAMNFDARGNKIEDNDVSASGAADLALVTSIDNPKDAGNNCFSDNHFSTTLPANLEQLAPCGKPASSAFSTDLARFVQLLTQKKPGNNDYKTVVLPKPPALPDMPDAATAAARPANHGVPETVDLASITTPTR